MYDCHTLSAMCFDIHFGFLWVGAGTVNNVVFNYLTVNAVRVIEKHHTSQ